jgi:hypothetical protein
MHDVQGKGDAVSWPSGMQALDSSRNCVLAFSATDHYWTRVQKRGQSCSPVRPARPRHACVQRSHRQARDDAGSRRRRRLRCCLTTQPKPNPKEWGGGETLLPLSSRAKCRRSSLCDPSIETSFRFTLRKMDTHNKGPQSY